MKTRIAVMSWPELREVLIRATDQLVIERLRRNDADAAWEMWTGSEINTGLYLYRDPKVLPRLIIIGDNVWETHYGRLGNYRPLDFAHRVVAIAQKARASKRKKALRLSNLDVSILKTGVRVGCQRFTWKQIEQLQKQRGWSTKRRS